MSAVVVAIGIVCGVCSPVFALDGKKAMHVGGTLTGVVPEKAEGRIAITDEEQFVFTADKDQATIEIPYGKVESLEYGQKASHRIKTAIFLTPWSLFSKKRRHYLSVIYKDKDDKDQAIVLELGKDILRPTVLAMEARSGKKVEFQDEEAKKHYAK
jgi:hypothetical protein